MEIPKPDKETLLALSQAMRKDFSEYVIHPVAAAQLGVRQRMEGDPADGETTFIDVANFDVQIEGATMADAYKLFAEMKNIGSMATEAAHYPVYPFLQVTDL